MKFSCLFLIWMLSINPLFAQEGKGGTNTLSVASYLDFTKSGTLSAYWATYDHKKISLEARYGYDWEKNISLYAGPLLKCRNWKIRLLQGVTFGNKTGISFSPTTILETKKIYVFNQPQYIIGFSGMPSNFSHWGEIYYKLSNSVWIGMTDRLYKDKTSHDFAFGPQLLISYKDFFITFYWWIPSKQTESRAFLQAGYEHDF